MGSCHCRFRRPVITSLQDGIRPRFHLRAVVAVSVALFVVGSRATGGGGGGALDRSRTDQRDV